MVLIEKIENCAKDGGRDFLPTCIVLYLRILNSVGIQLKNAMHVGKNFLAAIFSAIVY